MLERVERARSPSLPSLPVLCSSTHTHSSVAFESDGRSECRITSRWDEMRSSIKRCQRVLRACSSEKRMHMHPDSCSHPSWSAPGLESSLCPPLPLSPSLYADWNVSARDKQTNWSSENTSYPCIGSCGATFASTIALRLFVLLLQVFFSSSFSPFQDTVMCNSSLVQ